jgi:hypothetical protein
MPRNHSPAAPTAAPPAPFVIEANGIYSAEFVRAALRLKKSSLRTEWRCGRLRVLRRCGRNFFLGRDLLAWLDGGELPRPKGDSACQ